MKIQEGQKESVTPHQQQTLYHMPNIGCKTLFIEEKIPCFDGMRFGDFVLLPHQA